MNQIIQSLFDRKSVRVFEDKPISKEDKELILQAAIEAPTAGNQILYTIIDVTDQTILDKLAVSCDNQPFIATAKMCLIFCVDHQKWQDTFKLVIDNPRKPGLGSMLLGASDAAIAAQNAVVAAESLGIGSCYIGDILEKSDYHTELFNFPQYVYPIAMLVFGYPTEHQKNRAKPARFDQKFIVHENAYHRMDKDTLIDMFNTRGAKDQVNYEFEKWIQAFYKRKYDADFAADMQISVKKYFDNFNK